MVNTKPPEIEIIHCNECLHRTKHLALFEHSQRFDNSHEFDEDGCKVDEIDWWEKRFTLFECLGCENITLRLIFMFEGYEDGGPKIIFYPPQISRQFPTWSWNLPNEMQELLNEIYIALHSDNFRLALMGVRALIDLFMLDKVGDVGNFIKKLEALVNAGHLGSQQRDLLETVLDEGHAAAHRAHKLSSESLKHAIDVVEILLQSYSLEKTDKLVKAKTPPRPKVPKSKTPHKS